MANHSVIDSVVPGLPGVAQRSATVNGYTYKFLYAEPESGSWRATVFLIHGWPDISIGWRYQIPLLVDLGFRVVCPDLMGFGGTDGPSNSISDYGMKRASDDIKELARQLGISRIVLGGHDWGGFLVYRCALWHPDLVTHVFSVCTPYIAPSQKFYSDEDYIKALPQLGYQLHLGGPEVEGTVKSKEQIRQFLNGMYGARTPDGDVLFDPQRGVLLELLPKLGKTRLIPDDATMDYYVEEYARKGLGPTLNWYRTRKTNHTEELALFLQPDATPSSPPKINIPVLYIAATKDSVLLPAMSKGMEQHIPNLTRKEVDASHWALWEAREGVNAILREWFEGVVLKSGELEGSDGDEKAMDKGKL